MQSKYMQGWTFRKTLVPAVFTFSCQQKYFSEQCVKLAASGEENGPIGDPNSGNIKLWHVLNEYRF